MSRIQEERHDVFHEDYSELFVFKPKFSMIKKSPETKNGSATS